MGCARRSHQESRAEAAITRQCANKAFPTNSAVIFHRLLAAPGAQDRYPDPVCQNRPRARCAGCVAPPQSHSPLLAALPGSKDTSLLLSLSFLAFVFFVFLAVLALVLGLFLVFLFASSSSRSMSEMLLWLSWLGFFLVGSSPVSPFVLLCCGHEGLDQRGFVPLVANCQSACKNMSSKRAFIKSLWCVVKTTPV